MKARIILPIAIIVVSQIFISCQKGSPPVYQGNSKIRFGALLSLSGTGSSTGISSRVSVALAQQDINAWLTTVSRNATVEIIQADTKTDTAEALRQLRTFHDQGIRYIIGPYSSAEVAAIKPYADANGMIIVSPSSVAVSLSIPNDNIFRFVSCDVIQGEAMAGMLIDDSIRAIVPVVRNDVWGNDLVSATSAAFRKVGGITDTAVRYDPKSASFGSVLQFCNERVNALLETYPARQIAVYLCSFGEGTSILASASGYAALRSVKWYGSSAFAQNTGITSDTSAASFAANHLLPCPIYGLDESARYNWEPLKARIKAQTGSDPDVYSLAAYDAAWVGIKTYLLTGTGLPVSQFRQAFADEAWSYFGATGNTKLDASGDRAFGNYDFWSLVRNGQGYQWTIVARYNSASGRIIRNTK